MPSLPRKVLICLIFLVFLFPSTAFAQPSSVGSLKINPNNPHYLIYNGRTHFVITDASRSRGSAPGDPYNHKPTITITGTGRQFELYNNENLNDGWNEGGWDELRSMVRRTRDQGKIIGVEFWSTPMLECCEGRWGTHFWNEKNGGPIPDDGDGKGEFYTFASYDSEISGPYGSLSSWQERNQFRQEELVKKYLSELAEFDNVYFIPMYEMGDHYGSNQSDIRRWHRHIAKMVTDRQPERLIGTVISTGDEQWIAEMEEIDILLFEGPGIPSSSGLRDSYWSYDKPMLWAFIYPAHVDESDPYDAVRQMREAVVNGLQPAGVIRGQTSEQDDFAQRLSSFVDTVETWCDEPGQEITSSTVPGASGGSGTDLPPGSCSDDGGSASPTPTLTPTPLEGDIDKDGDVDIFDYNLLVENFGATSCGNVADINSDCNVNIFDYNILVENFGK